MSIGIASLSVAIAIMVCGTIIFSVIYRANFPRENKKFSFKKEILTQQEILKRKIEKLLLMTNSHEDSYVSFCSAYENMQKDLQRRELNLCEKWYTIQELAAKSELNGISMGKVEAVLDMTCDEIISSLDSIDYKLSNRMKQDFINENLHTAFDDVLEFFETKTPNTIKKITVSKLLKDF